MPTTELVPPSKRRYWAPAIIVVVLSFACLTWPFLWDDFDFLARAATLHFRDLFPDPATLFYRPISRELYFGLLHLLGASPLVGHLANLLLGMVTVTLVMAIASEFLDIRASRFAALVFASLGALPTLIGWISGAQDLLAMTFGLAALLCAFRGQSRASLLLFGLALLSKETAAALLPALFYARYTHVGSARRAVRSALAYSILLIAILSVHPIGNLHLRQAAIGHTAGYLGTTPQEYFRNVVSGLLTLANIPLGRPIESEFDRLVPLAIIPLLVILAAWWADRRNQSGRDGSTNRSARGLILGVLLLLPPLLPGALLRTWVPYQACFGAAGFAIFAGAALARLKPGFAWASVATYLMLGIVCRATPLAPTVTTESNLRRTGEALAKIEGGFKAVRPTLPHNATLYISAQFGGASSAYLHLYRYQTPRVWYSDPTLFVVHPHGARPGLGAVRDTPEFLFWVTPTFDVFEIDLTTLQPRGSGAAPSLAAYDKAIRRFAVGRAVSGRTEEAVWLLTRIDASDPVLRAYDRRLAGALLLAANETQSADSLLDSTPHFRREASLDFIMTTLADDVPSLDLDDALMVAFEISPDDSLANRSLMRGFERYSWREPAVRFARRVQRRNPSDPDARRILEMWGSEMTSPRITVPTEHE